MRLFLFLVITCMTSLTFSSEKTYLSKDIPKKLEDISFQVMRQTLSLESVSVDEKLDSMIDILRYLTFSESSKVKMLLSGKSNVPETKKDLLQFLLLETIFQKKILELSPEWIEKWIDVQITVEDLSYFKEYYPDLDQMIEPLDLKETLVFMPHFFLALGDRKIIETVFATQGFDPYFQTSLGNNLLHSFILLNGVKRGLKEEIKQDSYEKALQLLIEKSPSELLTQRNDLGLTPVALSVFIEDSISYQLLINSMPSRDIVAEVPILQREILKKASYNLLSPIYYGALKQFNSVEGHILIGKEGEVFLSRDRKRKDANESKHPIVKFYFQTLIPQIMSRSFISNFELNVYQKYEDERILQIARIFRDPEDEELKEVMASLFDRDGDRLTDKLKTISPIYDKPHLARIILEESIRNQFEEGVQISIHNMNNTDLFFYDSIFFSLLNYASLEEQHPRKKIAKNIIRTLASARDRRGKLSVNNLLQAVFFALPEELNYFIEEKEILLPVDMIEPVMNYALQKGYVNIFNTLNASLRNNPDIISNCRDIFIH